MFDADYQPKKTEPVEGFKMGRAAVITLLSKELSTTAPQISIMKDIYPEIVSLKIARGKKDPEHSGTIGFIVHADGSMEELDDKTKLSQLPWANLREAAIVIGYLSSRAPTYRVYNGEKLGQVFGITEEDDTF